MFFSTFGKNSGKKPRDWTSCKVLFLACEVKMSSQLHSPCASHLPAHNTFWSRLAKELIFFLINLLCSKRDSQGNLLFYGVAIKQNTKVFKCFCYLEYNGFCLFWGWKIYWPFLSSHSLLSLNHIVPCI